MPAPTLQLTHSPDGMRCTLGAAVAEPWQTTPEILRARLCEQGVPEELVLMDALGPVAEAITAGRDVEEVLVAKGRPAEDGFDAALYLEVLDQSQVSLGDDVVDHRDQGRPEYVEAGQRLGTVSFETAGRPGLTTAGRELPVRAGTPLDTRLGDGVQVGDEGLLTAAWAGFVILHEGVLEVRKELRIQGDVDYTTGHVLLDRGDIQVDRDVKPGFRLETPGSIAVKGDVEGATLVAGGDIVVQGLVAEGTGCLLQAGGSIQVGRVSGASLIAGGDVEVKAEAYEAEVRAGGVLRVTGRLVGGKALAAGGAEVGVAGGAAFTATRLAVGHSIEQVEAVRQRIGELEPALERLDRLIGTTGGRESLRQKQSAMRSELTQQQALLESLQAGPGKAVIVVKKTLYPGCVVEVDGLATQAEAPTSACTVSRGPDGHPVIESGRRAA